MGAGSNFEFLAAQDEQLARLGALAERNFHDDAPGSIIRLRQLAELLAKEVAARNAQLPAANATFDDVLRNLKMRSLIPRDVLDLLYHLKRVGNAAVHENAGTGGEALAALKMAREAALWFYRSYCGRSDFTKLDRLGGCARSLPALVCGRLSLSGLSGRRAQLQVGRQGTIGGNDAGRGGCHRFWPWRGGARRL